MSEQGDPTGTETPGFGSAPGATHIAGSRTPRSELRRRRLRRYAWAPQTIETDHPANGQGAHIAGYALPVIRVLSPWREQNMPVLERLGGRREGFYCVVLCGFSGAGEPPIAPAVGEFGFL